MAVLRVFGSGGSEGWPCLFCECRACSSGVERKRCGHVVEIGGVAVWLEASPDLRAQLLEYGRVPNYFFLSHAHSDHSGGLVELEQALVVTRNVREMVPNLIVPKHLHDHFIANGTGGGHDEGISTSYSRLLKKRVVREIICQPGEWVDLGKGVRAKTIDHEHGKIKSSCLIIEGERKRFVYISDIGKITSEQEKEYNSREIDLVLANTPFLEKREDKHISPGELVCLNTKRIVCSHFTHKNNKTHQEIEKELEKIDPRMIAARDGLVIEF